MTRLEREHKFRSSARGKRERKRSKHRFRHLRTRAALRVAEQEFGPFVASPVWSVPQLEQRTGKIKEYLSDTSAVVPVAGGNEILESSLPLRARDTTGAKAPVDLNLEAQGDTLRPANPLARVEVSSHAADGVAFPDAGFSVVPAADAASQATQTHGKAFFANTGTDADTVVTPIPGGVQFAALLRSPLSPNGLRLRFDLQPGDDLALSGLAGGAQVVRDGRVIATVAPPLAVDAQQRPVPASYSLDGSTLVVRVPHRSADYAYPILVDPAIEESWWLWRDGGAPTDLNGWTYSQTGPFNQAPSATYPDTSIFAYGAGLYVWADGEHSYSAGSWGMWNYRAPGDSFISKISYGDVDHAWDGRGCAITGFWRNNPNPVDEIDKWNAAQYGSPYGPTEGPSPLWRCGGVTNEFKVHCSSQPPGPCGWNGFTGGNSAVLQLRFLSASGPSHTPDLAHLGGIIVWEADNNPPWFTSVSDPNRPPGWTRGAAGTVVATATDNGLGVNRIGIAHPNSVGQTVTDNRDKTVGGVPCGDRNHRCPAAWRSPPDDQWSQSFIWSTDSLPEGVDHFGLLAKDAADRVSSGTVDAPAYESNAWDVKVDRSAPSTPDSWGEAGTNGAWVRGDGTHDVNVSATDAYSGVRRFDLTVRSAVAGADDFGRAVTGGWGSADKGGAWSVVTGSAARFSVDGSQGAISLPAHEADAAQLGSVGVANVRAAASFGFPGATAASGNTFASIDVRRSSDSFVDRIGLLRTPSGQLWIRGTNGAGGPLFADYDTGMADAVGARWNLAVRVSGSNPTTIQAKAWRLGDPEPAAWAVTASDTTAGMQGTGAVGIRVSNTDSTGGPVNVTVDDVRVYNLTGGIGAALGTLDQHCDAVNQCQTSPSDTYHWDTTFEQQGYHTLGATATDAVAIDSGQKTWKVGVDRTAPTLALSGSLKNRENDTVYGGTYPLHIHSTDGTAGDDETAQSGVVSLDVSVTKDGVEVDHTTYPQTCSPDSCLMDQDWSFQTEQYQDQPGLYDVIVTAKDAVGLTTTGHVTVIVGAPPTGSPDGLGLEDYFHYDSTNTGAGSAAHVNVANGNLVWHWVPLVNPGRGLTTFANLTYNSQSRLEDTLTPYTQVGKGFSLGISGITRVNEPLDVTKAVAGLVTLTDPDGTRHQFVSHDFENYRPPPGVHLRLRRYSAPGLNPDLLAEPDKAWAATRPDGVTYYFDAAGYATWIQDRNGNKIHFVYEYALPTGTSFAQACPYPDPTALGLDGNPLCVRRLARVDDAAGVADGAAHRSVTLAYDDNTITQGALTGHIASITDHLGRAIDFSYNADGYLTSVAQGRRTRTDDGLAGASRSFGFHYEDAQAGLPTITPRYMDRVTDPRGAATAFTFEPNSPTGLDPRRALSLTARGESSPTRFAYQQNGGSCNAATCTTITDARGNDTRDELDARLRLTATTDARGTRTELQWDDPDNGVCPLPQNDNQVCRLTVGAGTSSDPGQPGAEAVTDFAYNGNGLLTYKRDPVGSVTTLTYRDGPGTQTSPRLGSTDNGAGFVSDLTSITTPRGNATSQGSDFTYMFVPDEKGNVGQKSDPLGNVANTTFDATGQVTSEQDWHASSDTNPNTTTYPQYDANGLPRIMVDPRGNEPGGDPTQHRWFFTYDDAANLRRATDPRGATTGTPDSATSLFTTSFTYDALDQVLSQTVPKDSVHGVSITRSSEYDSNGNVTARIDGNVQRSTSSYTPMDVPQDVRSAATPHAGDPTATPELTHLAYDANQNLTDVTSPAGSASGTAGAFSTHYEYDAINERIQQTQRSRSPDKDLTTLYGYDIRGNLATVRLPRNLDDANSFGFYRVVYGYDLADHRTSKTEDVGDGGRALLTRMSHDPDGHLVQQIDPRAVDSPAAGDYTTTYSYDANGRQTDVIAPDGSDTRTVLRPDGRVQTLIKPKGISGGNPNGSFQTQFDYYATGELKSFTLPKAPTPYGPGGERRWTFCRDSVGDPTTILDPRASGTCAGEATYKIASTFFDTGEVRTTTRPAFWNWAGPGNGSDLPEPSPDEILARTQTPSDVTGDLGGTPNDPGGRQANGSFGQVPQQQLPDVLPKKGTTTFDYDGEMRLKSVVAGGLTTRLDYDPTGRLTDVTQPLDGSSNGIDTKLAYDPNGNLAQVTDGNGQTTDLGYDQFDRRTSIAAPAPNDTASAKATTRIGYDDNGNVTSVEKPAGNTTAFTYDSLERRLSSTDGAGGKTTFGYDDASNLTSVTSPCANADPTCADGASTTTKAYDGQNRVRTSTNPDGTTNLSYDGDGNLTRIDRPGAKSNPDASLARQIETRTYDGRDLPWTTTQGTVANKHTSVTEYDGNGDLRREVNPAGVDSTTGLPKNADSAPLVTPPSDSANAALKSATEQATLYEYSPDGQITARYLPWGSKDSRDQLRYRQDFTLDVLGRVSQLSSPHDVSDTGDHTHTTYTYFDTGWIRTSTDQPASQFGNEKVEYAYDKTGNQTKWCAEPTSASGCNDTATRRVVTRAYFPSGDLKSRTAEAQKNDSNPRSYDYSYDLNGNLTQFVDHEHQDHTTKASYDGADRNTLVNEAWSGGKDTKLAYDADGNVLVRKTDGHLTDPSDPASAYSGGKTSDFTFDSLGREKSIVVHPDNGGDPRRTDTEYWPSGERSKQTRYNGAATSDPVRATESFFYTDDGLLTRRDRKPAGDANDQQDYSYDANLNRTKDARGSYEFNSRDQLVKWTKDGKVTDYQLNGSGAITQKCETGSPCTTFNYVGDSTRLDTATSAGATVHYCYSNSALSGQAGDLTSIQLADCALPAGPNDITYSYDKFDRLKSSTGQNDPAPTSYSYDALDRRDSKCKGSVTPDCTGGSRTDLAYIGLTTALSSEERGASGSSGGQDRSYDYDSQLNRLGTDWKNAGGTLEYRSYLKGPDGTVEGLEGSNGVVAANETYKYDPYGADLTDNTQAPGTTPGPPPPVATSLDQAAQDNPFRFQGFYYDAGIKSYDMQAREYQPLVGRFTTPDRLESATADQALQADPLTQDRYAFAEGNPINNIEWDGHDPHSNVSACRAYGGRRTECNQRGAQVSYQQSPKGRSRRATGTPMYIGHWWFSPRVTFSAIRSGFSEKAGSPATPSPVLPPSAANARNFRCDIAIGGLSGCQHWVGPRPAPLLDAIGLIGLTVIASEIVGPEALVAGAAEGGSEVVGAAEGAAGVLRAGSQAAKGVDEIAPKLGSRGGPGTGSRHIPGAVKREEIQASQGLCRLCKQPVEPRSGSPLSREFDHAFPYSRGGDTTFENIQSLCRTCNRQKGARTTQEFIDWLFRVRR